MRYQLLLNRQKSIRVQAESSGQPQNFWQHEAIALRQVLAQMQSQLENAHERETRARYLATHDDLTDLPNRRYFREQMEWLLQGHSPVLAVIFIDLDGFKTFNDTYGHGMGDCLLHLVAARLVRAAREGDCVSRIGGDEFACLISGVAALEQLEEIGMLLTEAVSDPFEFVGVAMSVRPSIGIARYPSDGRTIDELLHAADDAMYASKRARSRPGGSAGPSGAPSVGKSCPREVYG